MEYVFRKQAYSSMEFPGNVLSLVFQSFLVYFRELLTEYMTVSSFF